MNDSVNTAPLEVVDYNRIEGLLSLQLPRLYAMVRSVVGSTEDAEDVLQELRLRVYTRWRQYDAAQGSPQEWFAGIARNLAIDLVRKKARRGAHAPFDEHLDSPVGEEAAGPDEPGLGALIARETGERVRGAIERLPAALREVVVFNYFLQRSVAQVATDLGLNEQAVYYRRRAAHKRLAELLSDLDVEPNNAHAARGSQS